MALVQKYCNPTGAGAHDGSTPADAWSFTEALAGVAAGNVVNMIAGSGNTYDNTTNTRTFTTPGTTIAPIWWRGYSVTPGDMDNVATGNPGVTIPALTVTTGSFNPVGNFQNFSNIDFSGATASGSFRMFNASSMQAGVIYRCRFRLLAGATAPCANIGGNNMSIIGCYFSSAVAQVLCQQSAGNYQFIFGNYFTGGSVGLQYSTGPLITIDCNIFDAIQGDAIQFTAGHCNMVGNSIFAPTGHGVTWSGTPAGGCYIANNHFENVNGASKAAINNASGTPTAHIHPVNNSYFGCTANVAGQGDNLSIWDYGTLAGSGFVNAAGHDFTPSALLLDKGFPGQFENITAFRGHMNLGALQSAAAAGGGRQPMYRIRGG